METTTAASLARDLMNQWGLEHFAFQFDRAKRRAGLCKYNAKTISLSYFYVQNNSEEDVKDTILHEIAHALIGPKNGHNHVWKQMCLRVGAKPTRCCGKHIEMPEGQWKAECRNCGKDFHKHRRPKYNGERYCVKCGPVDGRLLYTKERVIVLAEGEDYTI